jgi:hypothetical protein
LGPDLGQQAVRANERERDGGLALIARSEIAVVERADAKHDTDRAATTGPRTHRHRRDGEELLAHDLDRTSIRRARTRTGGLSHQAGADAGEDHVASDTV